MFSFFLFIVFWAGVSERPKQDAWALPWLVLYPAYAFALRMFSAFATMNEILRRGHEESNMAPWWVLSRGRRF